MKLKQSDLVKQRHGSRQPENKVLREEDPEFEETLHYALAQPYFNLIATRMRKVSPDDLNRLTAGLVKELYRRKEEG